MLWNIFFYTIAAPIYIFLWFVKGFSNDVATCCQEIMDKLTRL